MTLEERIHLIRNNYPDPMTQAQFGEAVGLSKSSTHKLLHDGIIPYEEYQEQLVHYHMIRMKDVLQYLVKKYQHHSQEYIESGKHCIQMMLWDVPDILSTNDIMHITGLCQNAIQKWYASGKLPYYTYRRIIIVRKSDLIDFLASPIYQDSTHKNIHAEAITKAVEWYQCASAFELTGGDD